MGVNKVDLASGETLLDLTSDTVTPQTLKKGFTAHNSKGESIVGLLVPEGGGGGSGIIDVTELPTENIDENAVYRVTENIQIEKTEIYLYTYGVSTLKEYLVSLGVPTDPNIYVVDNLSNMLESDAQTFSAINAYILKSDGIVYLNVSAYGGIIALGLFGFQAMGYDKGFTENIYRESEAGVYTTLENFKEVVRYFIREKGEWKEITAHSNVTTTHGLTNIDVYNGDITLRVFGASDIISVECTELDENWFIKRTGDYIKSIRRYMFESSRFTNVTIPHFIAYIYDSAFLDCSYLSTVTFKGKPSHLHYNIFSGCDNLTTINVPWSEGQVKDAPWGATNATINYNYTEG